VLTTSFSTPIGGRRRRSRLWSRPSRRARGRRRDFLAVPSQRGDRASAPSSRPPAVAARARRVERPPRREDLLARDVRRHRGSPNSRNRRAVPRHPLSELVVTLPPASLRVERREGRPPSATFDFAGRRVTRYRPPCPSDHQTIFTICEALKVEPAGRRRASHSGLCSTPGSSADRPDRWARRAQPRAR
jgi:hypothetical protein